MKKQIRSARIFTLGFIGEAEVKEGSGDCLALGVGSYGDTVAVVTRFDSPALGLLRYEMERNPLGFVSVTTMTGQAITEGMSWRTSLRLRDVRLTSPCAAYTQLSS